LEIIPSLRSTCLRSIPDDNDVEWLVPQGTLTIGTYTSLMRAAHQRDAVALGLLQNPSTTRDPPTFTWVMLRVPVGSQQAVYVCHVRNSS
jgi:hypothetical protein